MRSILSGLLLIIFILFLGVDVKAQEIKKEKKFHFNLFNKEKRQERKHEREREREGEEGEEENDEYDGPDKAAAFEYNLTKNPVTGKVPKEKLLEAIQFTKQSRADVLSNRTGTPSSALNLVWTERGPNSDVVGASNGNTRANSGITSGRIRAILVDSADATHKTVWIGGVDGGLWKTTDITTAPSNWTLVNDYLSNLAVTDICQDPSNNNIMYFCTGEAYYNADAVKGNGVFKSTDRGVTWTQLSSTTNYGYCTRILCDYQGNVYLGTRGLGLFRSNDGGSSWTSITPSGLTADICDLEISSTSTLGRLHVVSGIFSAQAYRYTDAPSTVSSTTWTAPVTAFPTYNMRAEIAVRGNVLYALPANATYEVPTIYKSTDGGTNWAATTGQPTSGWANGQGWYALSIGINPANTNQVIIGGLESYKTTDGGATWTKISTWVGTTGQYVHADIHKILWYDGGTKLLWGCDGGIHYSADGGTTIRDRNAGLRIKQFYSCAIHPTSATSPNYFLAGAQDNGTHQLNGAGLTTSTEVVGGDGCFVAIDQDQPQNQFGSYVYNAYRRSTNSGSSWSSINFNKGTALAPASFGSFINPFDYDNTANIIYAAGDAGEIFRWTTALTTAAGSYYATTGFPTGAILLTGITALNSSKVSCVAVSPYTANKVYFGTAGGRITYLANANTAASATAGVNLTGTFVTGSVSCINFGTTEQYLLATSSSYGVNNVMMSADAGTTWTAIDGNLPDMPVRWCMFYPGFNTKAIIATEMGVYTTDLINGASTIWSSSPTFPAVRTDMLKYRTADNTLLAATHGRGLWTTTIPICASTSSTTNVSRCPNQLPYLWNGTNYQTTGIYSYTTINSSGCDSVATLNFTVKQTSTSTTNASRCSNQLPYSWNGTNYQTTGVYSYSTTNAAGCDSVATLNFTVKQTSTTTTNASRCSNQLPYSWNGTNYQTTGVYSYSTTNAAGCDSVATLNFTVKQTSTSTTNASRCSNQLPYLWNGTNYQTTGIYSYTTINAAGCDSVATLNFTVKQTSSSITNVSRCSNQLPYSWNGTNYQITGTYSYTTTNAAGCDSLATLNFTVKQTSSSITNVSRCSNQLPYSWNGTNYQITGTYSYTTTNAAGCDSLATLNFTVKQTSSSITNVSRCSNQLPYSWNGTNYQTTGVYSYTTTNAAGCDSLATLNFTVKQTSSSSTSVSRCSNQLPYLWNGTNYQTTGVYSYTTTNAAGCDSLATLNFTVKQTSSSSTSVSRCSNQLPYLWNGTNYQTTGIYSYTTINAAGCDSVATLNFTVKQTSSSITNVSRCSNQLPYSWNGTNYQTTGTYSNTTTNAAGCDSVATLNFTVKQTSSSSTSVSRCSNQLPYLWNGTNYQTTGIYSYTTINAAGCDSVATLNFTVKQTSSSITNVSRCSNQLPYSWNGTNYQITGTYSYTTTNAAGCDSLATLNFTVKQTSSSITNVSRCSNQLPYSWNGTNYQITGTYSYTTTNAAGCDSVATLNFTVNQTSTSTTNVSRCSNQLPYSWNGTNYQTSGIFSFTTTNAAGCDSIATLNFTVKQTSSSITSVTRCSNQLPYSWNGTNYQTTGTYTYTTTNVAGCDSTATLNFTVNQTSTSTTSASRCSNQLPYLWNGTNYQTTGTYTYTTTNVAGCDSIATLNFTVNQTSTSTTNVSRCSNQLPYLWNGTNYQASGTYSFTTLNTAGCDSLAFLNFTVNQIPTVNAGTYPSLSVTSNPIAFSGTPTGGTFSGTGVSANTFNPAVSGVGTFIINYTYTDPVTSCTNTATSPLVVSASTCNFSVAAAITGNANACGNIGIGDSALYSITAVDASSYAWSVSNATNMGLSLNRSGSIVKVKYTTAFTTGTITVVVKGCDGTTITRTLSISKTVPGAPAAITGIEGSTSITYICPYVGGSNITYVATPPATNASSVISYRWTLPTGAQLVSVNAIDSSSITIGFPAAPSTLVLSVLAVSGCGNSAAKTLTLNKTAPAAPALINGLADVCASIGSASQSANVNYTIAAVNNAASYMWAVPIGATLVSGQGTTSVNVVFASSFVSGNMSVQSISPCGNSVAKTLTVYKRVAAAPAAVQKEFTPTSIVAVTNVCGLVSETYRIKKVTYATSYNWLLKVGTKATITHINALGVNDTAVIVTFLTGFTKDTLSVTSVTPCSESTSKTVALNATLLPPTPTSITSNTASYNACIGNQITYTVVVAAPTTTQVAASVYRWTKPNNTVIVSAATDSSSITLQFNTGYTGGSVTCKGQTPCGILGTAKTLALTHTGCPTGTIIIPTAKLGSNAEPIELELNVYPNPNDGNFNLDVKANSTNPQSLVILIIDVNGKIIKRYAAKTESGIFTKHFSESNLAGGIYTMRVVSNKTIKEVRLLIDKGVASVLNENVEEGRKK